MTFQVFVMQKRCPSKSSRSWYNTQRYVAGTMYNHLNGGKKQRYFEMHCTDRYGYKDHLFSDCCEKKSMEIYSTDK